MKLKPQRTTLQCKGESEVNQLQVSTPRRFVLTPRAAGANPSLKSCHQKQRPPLDFQPKSHDHKGPEELHRQRNLSPTVRQHPQAPSSKSNNQTLPQKQAFTISLNNVPQIISQEKQTAYSQKQQTTQEKHQKQEQETGEIAEMDQYPINIL